MHIIVPIKAVDFKSFQAQYDKIDGRADVVEIWLDQVEDLSDFLEAFEAFKKDTSEFFLGVCKSMDEGGDFTGGAFEKSELLDLFLKYGGDGVDFDIARNPLKIIAPFPSERLWLSFHDFEGVPSDLETILLGMSVLDPMVYKFAVTTNNKEKLDSFLQFIEDCPENLSIIFTTMGAMGLEGREKIGGRSWGGFYALDEASKTAEGQPTLEEL